MIHTLAQLAAKTPPPPLDPRHEHFMEIRDSFLNDRWGHTGLVFFLIAFLIGLLVLVLYRRYQGRAHRSKPMLTYHSIAEQVGIEWRDEVLLARIARARGLPSPLTLMVSRGTLLHHTEQYAATLSPRAASRTKRRTEALARLIFGDERL